MEGYKLLRMVTKNGQVINLYGDIERTQEMINSPKFMKMRDNTHEVYMSKEDIIAFEIIQEQEKDETPTPEPKE